MATEHERGRKSREGEEGDDSEEEAEGPTPGKPTGEAQAAINRENDPPA
ncbi:MAG: hypothetical protein JWM85_660 [Acidimicrobiaceae bacterium]|nr:hypothetical protein [Acidimicrobiaceae bacterium]